MANIQSPKGTEDVLPKESYKWQFIENLLLEAAYLYGYKEQRTPTFESIDLFQRGVGGTTDIVQKEMFEVKAGKSEDVFALKPEGTAGAVRCAIQNSLLNESLPVKVCYVTSCFRHERPQKGRLREFHQFGCEMFGAKNSNADVEAISLVNHIFDLLGLKNITLNINSIGCQECRKDYQSALKEYFSKYKDKLCPTCLERLDRNPMRILDCKSEACHDIAKDAPVVLDYLCDDCNSHFESVKDKLRVLNIDYNINTKIVRGLDYYTKTVFEFCCSDLGAQDTVCGGGRYDGLVSELGGKPTPALGFAMGLERLFIALETQGIEIPLPRKCDLYIGCIGEKAEIKALEIATKLRNEGFVIECDLMERSVKASMKYANKIEAYTSIIIGDEELNSNKANLKDLLKGEEKLVDLDNQLKEELFNNMLNREKSFLEDEMGLSE